MNRNLFCTLAIAVFALPAYGAEELDERLVEGRFGQALDAARGSLLAPGDAAFGKPPVTVELWARLSEGDARRVLISNGVPGSASHWEIAADRKAGRLEVALSGFEPRLVKAEAALSSESWRHVTLVLEPERLRLYVDGKAEGDVRLRPLDRPAPVSALAIGGRVGGTASSPVLIDDVRISRGVREVLAAPEQPLVQDDATIALWSFDESEAAYLARWTPGGETNQRGLPYPHRYADYEFEQDPQWEDGRWQETKKGPFVMHSTEIEGRQIGPKSMTVLLGKEQSAAVIYDLQRCSAAAAFYDARLTTHPRRYGLLRKPVLSGEEQFYVPPIKAWRRGGEEGLPPLDRSAIDYQGCHLNGDEVTLEYRVDQAAVFDSFSAGEKFPILFRSIDIDKPKHDLLLTLAELGEGAAFDSRSDAKRQIAFTKEADVCRAVAFVSATDKRNLELRGGDAVLSIAAGESCRGIAVYWRGESESLRQFHAHVATLGPWKSPRQRVQPGAARWGEPLVTQGVLGDDGGSAYVIDTITVPYDNPHGALFFISGLDFFENGDAAVCTAHGDVWIVRGLDDSLGRISWQRFATGLYQPMGLKVAGGRVVVLGRDQLTRLHDKNGDGEADFYESFNHDLEITGRDHAFALRLETDPAGNFYFLKSGDGPHGSALLKVSADGSQLSVIARGFRHPYGLGAGPAGEITVADNEGNWVPSSKIDLIEEGGFYGFLGGAKEPPADVSPERPLCYIPKVADNSCGGQTWLTSGQWGEYQRGEILHFSWGRSTLHAVLRQRVGDVQQAATVQFPGLRFLSGAGTGAFHPRDGQLYVVGLDGWQTAAVADGCFQRVRYTGNKIYMPDLFEAFENGVKIRFTQPLDRTAAEDVAGYTAARWNYKWSSTYGSFHWSLEDPDRVGHDAVKITGARLLPDGRSVFLEIPDMRLADQFHLQVDLAAEDGKPLSFDLYSTINALPPAADSPAPGTGGIFDRDNLVAWCIVPFDAQRRGPEQRAEMLRDLGLSHVAYDWRAEHIESFDEELAAYKRHGIELTAFWMPINSGDPLGEDHWPLVLDLLKRHKARTQLWVMLGDGALSNEKEKRVASAADVLEKVARPAGEIGCTIGLYNHGGWFGEPENQLAVIEELNRRGVKNVGIVYNFHHGHAHLPRFGELLAKMCPHLIAVNLNGMREDGPHILPIGDGDRELKMLQALVKSGYQGPIGILDHRADLDAAESLRQNLRGLERLKRELR